MAWAEYAVRRTANGREQWPRERLQLPIHRLRKRRQYCDVGCRSQFYEAELCRFTGVDPVDHPGKDTYAYASNNPINRIDSDGKQDKRINFIKQVARALGIPLTDKIAIGVLPSDADGRFHFHQVIFSEDIIDKSSFPWVVFHEYQHQLFEQETFDLLLKMNYRSKVTIPLSELIPVPIAIPDTTEDGKLDFRKFTGSRMISVFNFSLYLERAKPVIAPVIEKLGFAPFHSITALNNFAEIIIKDPFHHHLNESIAHYRTLLDLEKKGFENGPLYRFWYSTLRKGYQKAWDSRPGENPFYLNESRLQLLEKTIPDFLEDRRVKFNLPR